MPKSKNKVFFTVKQVAAMTNRSEKSVRRDIKAGKLKARHFGRSVRIGDDDLHEYVEENAG